jgi:HSP20 family protein
MPEQPQSEVPEQAGGTEAKSSAKSGGWPGFGELIDAVPSMFSHRWDLPALLNQRWPAAIGGFEPMKVEELIDDGTYVVRAEVPGVDPDEGIDVTVDNGRLTIRAEREQHTEASEANEFRSEFHYGSTRRSMTLPAGADVDKVKATYANGILEIRVPIEKADSGRTKVTVERTS